MQIAQDLSWEDLGWHETLSFAHLTEALPAELQPPPIETVIEVSAPRSNTYRLVTKIAGEPTHEVWRGFDDMLQRDVTIWRVSDDASIDALLDRAREGTFQVLDVEGMYIVGRISGTP